MSTNVTVDQYGPDGLTVEEWAAERLGNCHEIAQTKTDEERQGWLNDAWYWQEIVNRLQDARRLDFLDRANHHMNQHYGTVYGWKLEANQNRIALTDHNLPALTVRQAIDSAMNEAAANLKRKAS